MSMCQSNNDYIVTISNDSIPCRITWVNENNIFFDVTGYRNRQESDYILLNKVRRYFKDGELFVVNSIGAGENHATDDKSIQLDGNTLKDSFGPGYRIMRASRLILVGIALISISTVIFPFSPFIGLSIEAALGYTAGLSLTGLGFEVAAQIDLSKAGWVLREKEN